MFVMNTPLHRMIDHTLLKADATREQIHVLVQEAIQYQFASVCVHPYWVKTTSALLKNDPQVNVCTVIGFPLGATTTETKLFETKQVIENGASEIDMVINIGALKEKNNTFIEQEIASVVAAAKEHHAIVKVIIETSLLTEEEKIRACHIVTKSGADFVKTSTGFSTGGATLEDVKLLRTNVGATIGVKASGGIRDLATAKAMIEAGATRIGTSSGVAIIKELLANES